MDPFTTQILKHPLLAQTLPIPSSVPGQLLSNKREPRYVKVTLAMCIVCHFIIIIHSVYLGAT